MIFPSDYGEGATPVPIPNTVVKPFSADGTHGLSVGRVGRCWVFLFLALLLFYFYYNINKCFILDI